MELEFYSDIISKNLTRKNREYLKKIYFNNNDDWINTVRHILKYYNVKQLLITNLSIKVAQKIFTHTNKHFFPILIKCYKIGGSYNSYLFNENLVELYLGMSPSIFLLFCNNNYKIGIGGNFKKKNITTSKNT